MPTFFTTLLIFIHASLLSGTVAEQVQHAWVEQMHPVGKGVEHELTFWLHAEKPDAIHRAIQTVSSPTSPSFRQYVDDEEIRKLVAPKVGAVEQISMWLDTNLPGNYSTRLSKHGDFLFVTALAHDWGFALGRKLAFFKHTSDRVSPVLRLSGLNFQSGRAQHVGDSSSHIPALSNIVRAVFGLSDVYPVLPAMDFDSECNQFKGAQIDPVVIRAKYGNKLPPSGGRPGLGKHSQGIAAFEDAQFLPSDVETFQRDYNLSRVNISVLGPNKGGFFGEAGLDTEYIFSTGSGVDTWFLSMKGFDMLKWSFEVMNMSNPPAVLSVSWGSGESNFDVQHQHATTVEFAKMGLKGHTILAASGDDGTGGHGGVFGCKQFDPTWPASSPYVTSVGGTYLQSTGNTGSYSEIGWGFSGGGYSAVFPRPSYQDTAASAYSKATTLPPTSFFNISGRITPDVSALSTNFRVLAKGAYGCLSGTSAATPVFAGLISLLNDEQVAAGKPTLGFINTAIYGANEDLGFDVIDGNNKHQFCKAGFSAATGFDAVTGWGTPQMDKLRSILTKA